MKLIMCVDENWGIGKDGDLLIKIPDDLKRFKEITKDSIVIMGRKTLDSLPNGKPLKDRVNIVLTKEKLFSNGTNLMYVNTLDEVLFFETMSTVSNQDVYVIGGESIIKQLMPYIDHAYITYVSAKYKADKHMPNLDELDEWELVEESGYMYHHHMEYTYREYRRKYNG